MRKLRITKEGGTYHCCARINRSEMIFINESFKELLLKVIKEAKMKYNFLCANFCIMNNHFHIDIKPGENESLSRIMQWILSVFAKRFNKLTRYKGHVWYDRFKSKVIDSFRQYVNTFLYIANNPVRAGVVKDPFEYAYNGVTFYKTGKYKGLLEPPTPLINRLLQLCTEQYAPGRYSVRTNLSFEDKRAGRPKKTH